MLAAHGEGRSNPFILPIRALRRHVASNDADAPLPLEDALVLLAEAAEARATADARLGRCGVLYCLHHDESSKGG